MPHITLECSKNVKIDAKAFFDELCHQLTETGHAPKLGMKCRMVKSKQFYIIDGNPDYKMVNLLYRLREGRSEEVLINFSEIGMSLLEKYLQKDCEETNIIISTEIKELKKGIDLNKNYIRKKFEK
ncbi:MAG: hypothetical protein HKO66_14000 [Saprospiraceae bacterium]|nr:5-carboxymethyl-2-hydroxymuconate Delta-isomerase [Bacteroidia bacterium]NNE15875.1 hypothetical protein [Saprospiraceae bacterium]NNL93349.1 hypothetical protein [Saprospiraceae bacterium]